MVVNSTDALVETCYGTLCGYIPHPRNFNITPNGRFVLVCCRDNDSVEIYERDAASGLLTFTGRRLTQTRPVYIGW